MYQQAEPYPVSVHHHTLFFDRRQTQGQRRVICSLLAPVFLAKSTTSAGLCSPSSEPDLISLDGSDEIVSSYR